MEKKINGKGKKLAQFLGLTCAGFALGFSIFILKRKAFREKKPDLKDKEIQAELEQFPATSFMQSEQIRETPQLISESSPAIERIRLMDEKKVAQVCLKLSEEIKDQLTELRQKYSNDMDYYNNSKTQYPLYLLEEELIEEQKKIFCEAQSIDLQQLNNFIQTMDNQKFFHELVAVCKKQGIYIRLLEIEEIQEIVEYYLQQLRVAETQNPDLDQLGLRHQAELKMRLKYGIFQDMLIFLCKSLQVVCGINDQALNKEILKIDSNFIERGFVQSIIIILSILNSISQASQFQQVQFKKIKMVQMFWFLRQSQGQYKESNQFRSICFKFVNSSLQ